MVNILYKKKGIRIAQIWFMSDHEEVTGDKTDIIFFHGIKNIKKDGSIYRIFHTLFTDLTKDEDKLLSQISKNYRYEIRRSLKEDGRFRFYNSKDIEENDEILLKLGQMYHNMYKEKGIRQVLNIEQMKAYAREGALGISEMSNEKGESVVIHSYLYHKEQARLLHSASEFRNHEMDANYVARSNKRLHWEDLIYLKRIGIKEYDWGGISNYDQPNGIDEFKMKFGGLRGTYYNQFCAKSTVGKAILWIMKIKGI